MDKSSQCEQFKTYLDNLHKDLNDQQNKIKELETEIITLKKQKNEISLFYSEKLKKFTSRYESEGVNVEPVVTKTQYFDPIRSIYGDGLVVFLRQQVNMRKIILSYLEDIDIKRLKQAITNEKYYEESDVCVSCQKYNGPDTKKRGICSGCGGTLCPHTKDSPCSTVKMFEIKGAIWWLPEFNIKHASLFGSSKETFCNTCKKKFFGSAITKSTTAKEIYFAFPHSSIRRRIEAEENESKKI